MLARKDEVVKGLTDGVRFLFRKNRVETIFGTGRVSSPTSVSVALNEGGSVDLQAGHILLATGSEPASLPFLPFNGRTVVDSTGALSFEQGSRPPGRRRRGLYRARAGLGLEAAGGEGHA